MFKEKIREGKIPDPGKDGDKMRTGLKKYVVSLNSAFNGGLST